jgi:hypothetical protein
MYENNIKTTVLAIYTDTYLKQLSPFWSQNLFANKKLKVYFFTTGQITSLNIWFYWKAQKEYLRSIIRFCTILFGL